MFDNIMYSLAIIFMLIGFVSVINFLIIRLITPERKRPYAVVIPLTNTNNPASLISCAIEKRSMCGETHFCEIVAVDLGMNDEQRKFIENMYSGNYKFTLCDYNDMQYEIENILHGTLRGADRIV